MGAADGAADRARALDAAVGARSRADISADDRDFRSKGIFMFLIVIMTLAEKDEKTPSPVVAIPTN